MPENVGNESIVSMVCSTRCSKGENAHALKEHPPM